MACLLSAACLCSAEAFVLPSVSRVSLGRVRCENQGRMRLRPEKSLGATTLADSNNHYASKYKDELSPEIGVPKEQSEQRYSAGGSRRYAKLQKCIEYFKLLDADGSGYITIDEWERAARAFGMDDFEARKAAREATIRSDYNKVRLPLANSG